MLILLLSLACSNGKQPLACGPDEVCQVGEYCVRETGTGTQELDSNGDPIDRQLGDVWSCETAPTSCGDTPTCACLDCGECEDGAAGAIPTCTAYRP